MIKFENVGLASPEQMEFIIEGMRNPMNSWEKSDSGTCLKTLSCHSCHENRNNCKKNIETGFILGENDHSLMQRLSNAGTEHRKYMRMMPVYVRITAPLYWWKEFDTYSVGVAPNPTDIIMNSCSTMHKIAEKEFTLEDFSCEHLNRIGTSPLWDIINILNISRTLYLEGGDYKGEHYCAKDKQVWWQMIQLLPSSYNQTRNVMMNYEFLANIYLQRKNHKLDEWREFCKWIEGLPYSELIADQGVDYCRKTLGRLSPMLEPGYAYAQNECINSDVGQISDQISKDALVEMTEMSDDTDRDAPPKKVIFGDPM